MKIAFSAALLLSLTAASQLAAQIALGSYVARSLDGRPLPVELRLATTRGYYRWLRLEETVLRLQAGGRFTVFYRYREQQVEIGKRPTGAAISSDTERGIFELSGDVITLRPALPKKGKRRPPTKGRLTRGRIILPYVLRDGPKLITHSLLLERDPSYW
jgi:hypothetical protein